MYALISTDIEETTNLKTFHAVWLTDSIVLGPSQQSIECALVADVKQLARLSL